jgi:CheY-like chemotaxis protein
MPQSSLAQKFQYVSEARRRVLVVDDDPIQREFAAVYLGAPGVELEAAGSGREALSLLERAAFDIMLVDYEMPGMDGLELIHAVRSHPVCKGMPVIMVTSHEDIATIDAAFKAGATSFVTKPVNWRLLSYQIEYVLREHLSKTAA